MTKRDDEMLETHDEYTLSITQLCLNLPQRYVPPSDSAFAPEDQEPEQARILLCKLWTYSLVLFQTTLTIRPITSAYKV